jgi:hypothetical protein
LVIDTVAPGTPALVSAVVTSVGGNPAVTALSGSALTRDAQPVFTGTAEALSTLTIRDNGNAIATVQVNAQGQWQWQAVTPLAEGGHSLTFRASDAAGNISGDTSALAFTVDSVAPAAPSTPVVTPLRNTPTLNGTAEANAKVEIYSGNTLLKTVMADGSGAWSATLAPLTDAIYSFKALAIDAAGNVGPVSADTSAITINTQSTALGVIRDHTTSSTGAAIPSLLSYSDAGVTGVNAGNLASVNSAFAAIAAADSDTLAEVQGVVDSYLAQRGAIPGHGPARHQHRRQGGLDERCAGTSHHSRSRHAR